MSPPPTLNTDLHLLSGDRVGTHQVSTSVAKNFAGRPIESGRAAPRFGYVFLSSCLGQSDLIKSTEMPVSCGAKFLLALGAPQLKHHCANIRRLVKQPSAHFFSRPKIQKNFPILPLLFPRASFSVGVRCSPEILFSSPPLHQQCRHPSIIGDCLGTTSFVLGPEMPVHRTSDRLRRSCKYWSGRTKLGLDTTARLPIPESRRRRCVPQFPACQHHSSPLRTALSCSENPRAPQ